MDFEPSARLSPSTGAPHLFGAMIGDSALAHDKSLTKYAEDRSRAARRALRVVNEFRKISPTITVNVAALLLTIAARPGITSRDLRERLGLSSSGVTRALNTLTLEGTGGVPGLGLVDTQRDPMDRRFVLCTMTPRGRHIVDGIAEILQDTE